MMAECKKQPLRCNSEVQFTEAWSFSGRTRIQVKICGGWGFIPGTRSCISLFSGVKVTVSLQSVLSTYARYNNNVYGYAVPLSILFHSSLRVMVDSHFPCARVCASPVHACIIISHQTNAMSVAAATSATNMKIHGIRCHHGAEAAAGDSTHRTAGRPL